MHYIWQIRPDRMITHTCTQIQRHVQVHSPFVNTQHNTRTICIDATLADVRGCSASSIRICVLLLQLGMPMWR